MMNQCPDYVNLPLPLYKLLDSLVNYDSEVKRKINELAEYGREYIFDFNYPLSEHVVKADFEKLILNHFIRRRIGYDTVTAFKIALDVKMNEIMPMYNKLFDALNGWDVFEADSISRSVSDSTSNTVNSTDTSDRRYSNLPQGELDNVKDGDYVTDYNYDTNISGVISGSTGSTTETITRTSADKIKIWQELLEAQNSIYTMIFKDLDSLFYQLLD